MNIDYTEKVKQRLVKLTMKNGDSFEILSVYDEEGGFWYSDVESLGIAIANINSQLPDGYEYKFRDEWIDNCEFADVEKFNFLSVIRYSTGEVCSKAILNEHEIKFKKD